MPNILNCQGFAGGDAVGWFNLGGECMSARLALIFLFFLIAMVRKWGGEEIGVEYNFWFSIIAGVLLYLIIITIFGSTRAAFFISLISALAVGYGIGFFIGGDGE